MQSAHITDVIGSKFLAPNMQLFPFESLKPIQIWILYFSASWCRPCRNFGPFLHALYKSSEPYSFEVVFVSRDHTKAEFKEYFATMPWLAIPFDSKEREDLVTTFNVDGIPRVVILNNKGDVLNDNAAPMIKAQLPGFPWTNPQN